MPDIDPAALSRPAGALSAPSMAVKTLPNPTLQKPKTNPLVPPRIDLEPLYVALRSAISTEEWKTYKAAITKFLIGHMSIGELTSTLNPILLSPNGERERLHNRLISAIYGNVTREMPEPGLAAWVSANDKPVVTAPTKPSSSDAAEKKLKGEVMQLPNRDRRRMKDLSQIETPYDPFESLANAFADAHRRPMRNSNSEAASGGTSMEMSKSYLENEARKRFAAPLAVESGEFPDASTIESRMLPICYQAGLASGHSPDSVSLMVNATDTFIKSVIATAFSRTRSNGPGEGSSTGFGFGTGWIQTHGYKRKLHREEESALRGEVFRDKSGLLPIEAKAASERGPLTMADLRLALDLGETGFANFPVLSTTVINGYRDGELENYEDYSYLPVLQNRRKSSHSNSDSDNSTPALTSGLSFSSSFGNNNTNNNIKPLQQSQSLQQPQSQSQAQSQTVVEDPMDIDIEITWDGADCFDEVDSLLDACLSGPL